jgi:tetratricopeptide (TPR) repeat protein
MSNASSLFDRYLELIDRIVETTLQGKIRSFEQVYTMLVQDISSGTGEIFERCLSDRLNEAQTKLNAETSETKKAKIERTIRALQTIQKQWERWLKQNAGNETLDRAVTKILTAEPNNKLLAFLTIVDPNQAEVFTIEQLQKLAKTLKQKSETTSEPEKTIDLAEGISAGLGSIQQLQDYLISWIYDQSRRELGFEGIPGQYGPWAIWAKQVKNPLAKQLFETISFNRSIDEFISKSNNINVKGWVELVFILQGLQRGLVAWFEKQSYDSQWGTKQSIGTFLTFAAIWWRLSDGLAISSHLGRDDRQQLANASFQVMLQILRAFAQKLYFPLYGGVFASFTGEYLRDTLAYLDAPLRQAEGTQEKARILTLLGYSQRTLGQYGRSIAFHEEALAIARQFKDIACEIANLNHLSRTYLGQKNYAEAINYSQRALILARSVGEKLGETNALVNLGYSEVLAARQQENAELEVYERAIEYLDRGLKLSTNLSDRQSQALAYNSLGIASVVLEQSEAAIKYLEKAIEAANFSGDLYLQGLNFAYLAQAYYSLKELEKAIYIGCLGMYLLQQIEATQWRQPAGLLLILQGQIGIEAWQKLLAQHRSKIIAVIGVDGYDYLPQLLEQYKKSI